MNKALSKPGEFKPVYKSECKRGSGGATAWNEVHSDTDTMADDNDVQEVMFQVFQYNSSGTHKRLGSVTTTLGKFREASSSGQSFELDTGSNCKLVVTAVEIKKRESFLDYIFGGCEVGLHIAFDFTLSNGNPSNPSSLHFDDPYRNQYSIATYAVGGVLQNYDSDQKFPIYGFGGQVLKGFGASHCFAMNGDIFNPEVIGLDNVIRVYRNSLHHCALYGPTNFGSILAQINAHCAHQKAEQSQYNQKYNILLILTDGAIMDMQQTIDELVAASDLPLSVIIVGVGDADFGAM